MELVQFNKAKYELALATEIDEVKEIRDKAEALRAYAKQSGESLKMQNQCAEIKIRAERRGGELLKEQEKHKGAATPLHDASTSPPKLKDLGINHTQSSRWQAIAEIPEEIFEEHIAETKKKKKELTSVGVQKVAKKINQEQKRAGLKPAKLPEDKYRIIYADPPWKYSDELIEGYGAATHHYPIMSIKELCELDVKKLATDNAVLFLWVTSPLLAECWAIIEAWEFKYKSSFVWDKVRHNYGHYNSVRHELLLICTKGSCLPDVKKLYDSVQEIEKSTKHSEKPDEFRKIIDALYPHGNRIELFARRKVPGNWVSWGNEV